MRSLPILGAVGGLLFCANAFGAAVWSGTGSNNFNDAANWKSDDSPFPNVNPAGQNLQFYNAPATNLSDIQVMANINAGSLSMLSTATENVTVSSSGGLKIRLTSSGIQSSTAGVGTLTINAGLTIAIDTDRTWNLNSNVVINGAIESEFIGGRTRSITKTGSGTLTLGGTNTWGGGGVTNEDFWFQNGTLNLNNAQALGTYRLVLGVPNAPVSATLDNTSGATVTLANPNGQSWRDGFIFAGTNSLTMNGNILLNPDGGGITVNVQNNTLTLNGVISGPKLLSKFGQGTMTLNNNNTFSAGMFLRQGTLNLGHAGAVGTGTFTFGQGPGGSFTLDNTSGATMTLVNNNAIVLTNSNTLNFTGTNDLNMGTGNVTLGDFNINVNGGTLTFGGAIANESGGKSLVKGGQGTLVLNGASSFGNASNGVDLQAGTIKVGNANALGATGNLLRIFGGTLDVAGNSAITLANPTQRWQDGWIFAGSQNLNMGTGGVSLDFATGNGVTVSVTNNTLTVDGVVSGGKALGKSGAGTMVLNAVNTFTGATVVSGGKLIVNGSVATSQGTIVNANGTLGGSGVVSAITGMGTISPGNSAGILTAPSIDVTDGLDFTFALGQLGGPTYGSAAASGNDVLRVTGGAVDGPFDSSNTVSVLFNKTTLSDGDTFRGGIFLDASGDFLSAVSGGNYVYYVLGNGNGTHAVDGVNYYTLAEFGSTYSVTLATVSESASFAGGSANGEVMQFTVGVPEPTSLGLVAMAGLAMGARRRRRC